MLCSLKCGGRRVGEEQACAAWSAADAAGIPGAGCGGVEETHRASAVEGAVLLQRVSSRTCDAGRRGQTAECLIFP